MRDPPQWLRCDLSRVTADLARQHIERKLREKGLRQLGSRGPFFFPSELFPEDKLKYLDHEGRRRWIKVVGHRSRESRGFTYHLSPELRPQFSLAMPRIEVRTRLFIDSPQGTSIPRRSIQACRKQVTRSWFNWQWLARQLAIMWWLADGEAVIPLGGGGSQALTVSAQPLSFETDYGIDETRLIADRSEEDEAQQAGSGVEEA